MNKQKKIIAETLYDIKQRYEDTSYVIHREHQKRLGGNFLSFGNTSGNYAYSSYGNTAVVVQKRGNDVTKSDEKSIESKDHWYAITGSGKVPVGRVGHTLSFVSDVGSGIVVCIGGADPSGPFEDIYILDLGSWHWEVLPTKGFRPRYEHVAFVPSCADQYIYVVGGANQSGNMTHMQKLDVNTQSWQDVEEETTMSPRTHHTCALVKGKQLVMFGGGHSGADPVDDEKVHVYDVCTGEWSSPEVNGRIPETRQGHVMSAISNKVYLHGGMKKSHFFDDLHVLDMETSTWSEVIETTQEKPCARAAHGVVEYQKRLYIFGGMTASEPLNDMFSFDSETTSWTKIKFGTPPPSPRLDFAMCVIEFKKALDDASDSDIPEKKDSSPTQEEGICCAMAGVKIDDTKTAFILIQGGMNTTGDMFEDCFLFRL